jgi:hypothetical protein
MVYQFIFMTNTTFMSIAESDPVIFLSWHKRPDEVQSNSSHEVLD